MFVFICITVALISLGFGFTMGISMLSKRKAILNTPQHHPIEKVTDKSAREGLVVPLTIARAPFSQDEVVFCEAKAKQMRVDKGKVQSQVFTEMIYEFNLCDPFILQDEDGSVLVCPEGGFMDVDQSHFSTNYSHKGSSIVARPPDSHIQQAMNAVDAVYTDGDGPVPIDFMENSIKPDERIFVMGMRYHDPAAIKEILQDYPIKDKEKIVGVFRHSEEKDEGFYMANGSTTAAANSLRNIGGGVMFVCTLVAAIAIALAISELQ